MTIKSIISTILIIVSILLIFSYITNPMTKYQVKEFFSEVKSNVKDNIATIPTLQKNLCENKAEELIPKYFILSNDESKQVDNYWNDNQIMRTDGQFSYNNLISMNIFRKGSKKGENINYFYFEPNLRIGHGGYNNIPYSKTIISKEGEVLGTRKFTIKPIIKLQKKVIEIIPTINYFEETRLHEYFAGDVDKDGNKGFPEFRVIANITFTWSGFDSQLLHYYNLTTVNTTCNFPGCSFVIDKESGTFNELIAITNFDRYYVTYQKERIEQIKKEFSNWVSEIHSIIINNDIYEIIEPNIETCEWV